MKKLTHDQISLNRSTIETLHNVKRLPVYVILNSIRSSYNVGSIFRTSDGVMIEKLYLCLRDETPEISVDAAIAEKAIKPIRRMLDLSAQL